MTLDYHDLLGALASVIAIFGVVPYLYGIHKGVTRPHLFAWIIWCLLTAIAFAGQLAGGGGAGAWSNGMASLLCIAICVFTWRQGEFSATRIDWAMFISGLAAIPLWMVTDSPLVAVAIVTAIEAVAFAMTFRKSWHHPHHEKISLYALNMLRHVVAIPATVAFNTTTLLFPVCMLFLNTGLIAMLIIRRRKMTATVLAMPISPVIEEKRAA